MITGPGRSGTSFLAGIFKELGFSPGGSWDEANRGGWESPEITHRNQALLRRLGVTAYGPPERYRELSDFVGGRVAQAIKDRLPQERRQKLRRVAERLPFQAAAKPTLIPFDLADEIIGDERADLRRLAATYSVAKDPLFSWTLPIWLGAGADVSHVIISTRNVDDALASHDASEHWQFKSSSDAKNSLLYSLGVTIWSCLDRGVPFTFVRYPDFLDDVRGLHDSLVFPDEVTYDQFEAAFSRVYRPALVNAYRRDQDE